MNKGSQWPNPGVDSRHRGNQRLKRRQRQSASVQRSWIQRRSIVASLLAFVYPGLGHVYLRAWLRALAWFGLALVTAAMVIPESALTAFQSGGLSGLLEASQNFPLEVTLSLFVVRILNVIDAYLTGLQRTTEPEAEPESAGSCPECGRELDEDLDFCPWCTTRLDGADESEETEETDGATVR